jgi:hypothetical protein
MKSLKDLLSKENIFNVDVMLNGTKEDQDLFFKNLEEKIKEEKKEKEILSEKKYIYIRNRYKSLLSNYSKEITKGKEDEFVFPEYMKQVYKYFFFKKYIDYISKREISDEFMREIRDKKIYERGLMLVGGTGVGKTSIINYCRQKIQNRNSFENRSEIARDCCIRFDNSKIKEYLVSGDSNNLKEMSKNLDLFIDDIGQGVSDVNSFGTKNNIIHELMQTRYNVWQNTKGKCVTHITTNFNGLDWKRKTRSSDEAGVILDRVKEMFFVIEVPENTKSLRKYIK